MVKSLNLINFLLVRYYIGRAYTVIGTVGSLLFYQRIAASGVEHSPRLLNGKVNFTSVYRLSVRLVEISILQQLSFTCFKLNTIGALLHGSYFTKNIFVNIVIKAFHLSLLASYAIQLIQIFEFTSVKSCNT